MKLETNKIDNFISLFKYLLLLFLSFLSFYMYVFSICYIINKYLIVIYCAFHP